MSANWPLKKISEVADVVGGGTPSSKVDEYYGGEISWITPKDLSNYNFRGILKGKRSITELGLKKSSAKIVPKNTVLMTSRAPIGYVAISQQELCTNQGFKSLILKEGNDPDFFYYLLKFNVPLFESRATGSTFKEISGQVLKDTKLRIPTFETQRTIGKLLKSIDDKIELNHQTNETLEKLAQAIFKSWFVDFDPVKAKAKLKKEGGDLDLIAKELGMSKEILELFPDEFEESEMGLIPNGWALKPLYETAEYINGSAFKATDFSDNNEGLPIIKIAELKQGVSTGTKFTLNEVKSKYFIDSGDVLYSWSGSPETSLEVFKWHGGKGWLIVDDLVDTGKTAAEVRALFPNAHFATLYAKPAGIEYVDSYVEAVTQNTWIRFPWDMKLSYADPIVKGG